MLCLDAASTIGFAPRLAAKPSDHRSATTMGYHDNAENRVSHRSSSATSTVAVRRQMPVAVAFLVVVTLATAWRITRLGTPGCDRGLG